MKDRKQKNRLAPFVPIFHDELESTAYRELPPSAAKLLPYFKRVCVKATRGAPDTSTLFGFTYTEAEKYGFARKTFSESIKALEKHGFIDIVSAGGLRGAGHTTSKYRLSNRWVTFGGLEWARAALKAKREKAERERNLKPIGEDGTYKNSSISAIQATQNPIPTGSVSAMPRHTSVAENEPVGCFPYGGK